MNDQSTVGVLDQFQTDLVAAWRRLPNKTFFFVLLGAWLLVFQLRGSSILGYIDTSSLFSWLFEAYNSPNPAADDGHGNFIPFLVLGLFWWKRKEILAAPLSMWMPGLVLILAGMLLHVAGYIVQEPRVSVLGLFTGIYGIMGLAWGPQCLRRSFFPFFLFVFSIPLGSQSDFITFRLRLLVCQLVEVVAHNMLGIHVLRVGTQLFDPSGAYQYDVAPACSGMRSLIAVLLLSTAFGFLTFRSWWKRLFLMVMAFPFAVLGNLLRMLCIVFAADLWGQKAGDYVHEGGPLGIISFLPYVPAILGVLLLGHWLREEPSPEPAKSPEPSKP